jgi:hypothetical protein
VGQNEYPLAAMDCPDGASWDTNRPDGVAFCLQIIANGIESKGNVAFNIFTNNPTGFDFPHDTQHVRPHVPIVGLPAPVPGCTKWLAWVATVQEFNSRQFACINGSHIVINLYPRPVLRQNLLAKRITLTKSHSLKPRPFRSKVKSTNPRKQTQCIHSSQKRRITRRVFALPAVTDFSRITG